MFENKLIKHRAFIELRIPLLNSHLCHLMQGLAHHARDSETTNAAQSTLSERLLAKRIRNAG